MNDFKCRVNSRKKLFVVFLALLLLIADLGLLHEKSTVFASSGLPGNRAANDFSLTDLNGKRVSLADYRGKVILIADNKV